MFPAHGDLVESRLIYKGAEAEIYLEAWMGELVIRKTRTRKPYRLNELDEAVRRARTSNEAGLMHEVRKLGVPVPTIQRIDQQKSTLIMEFVKGPTLKEELSQLPLVKGRLLCNSLGQLLGLMHQGGIVHGDMTISNVLSEDGKLFIIDFGLGNFSSEVEDRGVDLLVLNRAMKSTHYSIHTTLFQAVLKGYFKTTGKRLGEATFHKMKEIERRGRYFERG